MATELFERFAQYLGEILASSPSTEKGVTGTAHSAEIDPFGGVVLRWGTTLDWAITITLVICVLILVGIVFSRIVFRGRQTEGNALWLHLLVLGILPMFLWPIGNFTALEYAKEERNCSGCHRVLQPYVDDMRNHASTSLAALHHQNRFAPDTACYSCHTNYGVHGSVEGKVAGLGHAFRYLTNQYRMPLKISKPFPNTMCLKCHHGAKRFMTQSEHLDGQEKVSFELISGKTQCIGCHEPAHRIAHETSTTRRAN